MLTRRRLIALSGIATAGGAMWWHQRSKPRPRLRLEKPVGRQPNILLIVTDQERARHLIPSSVALPQRDRMMECATVFRNATAVSNLCTLSRATLYSGQHPQNNGVWENTPLPYARAMFRHVPTLGTLMQDCGYATGYFGKWHLSKLPLHEDVGATKMARLFRDYGFEHSNQPGERDGAWDGYEYDPQTADTAARFIHSAKDDDRPWFAAVNFVNPHDVMFYEATPDQAASRVNDFPDRILPPPEDPVYGVDHHLGLPTNFGPSSLAGKPSAQQEFQKVMALSLGEIPYENAEAWAGLWNYYLNCLRDVDRHLETVLDALEKSGQADNTIVIYTSDHGEMAGVHGLREKGGNLYREASNVPLWIRHPDISGGSETMALASLVDVAPTLLSFAGVQEAVIAEQAPYLIGHDLAPALSRPSDPKATGRDAALCQWTSLIHMSANAVHAFADVQSARGFGKLAEFRDERIWKSFRKRGHMRGLYDGRYKFARYFSPRQHHLPDDWNTLTALNDLELYDTERDPGETRNLAAMPQANEPIILELNKKLNRLIIDEIGVDDGSNYPWFDSFWRIDRSDLPT